jgi:tRNA threonylcarbamoyladenosine biosynthesis protein TsaE
MNFPKEFISHSPQDTEKFAADFAKQLNGGDIVAFYGDLGAGKTCFVRGLAAGLGIDPYEVCSPTFALVNVYDKKLAHFDMYRISSADEIESTGFYDFDNIIRAVEWPENITECIPKNAIKVTITASETEENLRIITIGN